MSDSIVDAFAGLSNEYRNKMKLQIPNSKIQINSNTQNQNKIFALDERTYVFAKNVAVYCKKLPKTISNIEYTRQLIRSSGSVGAKYIEANESLSKKDFIMRIKICRKESKESAYWLRLLVDTNPNDYCEEGNYLKNEAIELKKIFNSIVNK